MKLKTVYRCQNCGYTSAKWIGQCSDCQQWNTMVEEVIESSKKGVAKNLTDFSSEVIKISQTAVLDEERICTKISEIDRLFGGGLIKGQIVLLAGHPGIGKSTLILQIANNLSKEKKVFYVTGEESPAQIGSRAKRLKINAENIFMLAETNLQKIINTFNDINPEILIIDSIQTVSHPEFSGSPGTIGQVRESAAELLRLCKSKNCILFLLGHVTKEGTLAGPKVLEHIVDTVLYFDTERHNVLRILRVYKNRFGPTSEIGIFQMSGVGLKSVNDAGHYFLSGAKNKPLKGRAFSIAAEGSRPILTEIQALVSPTRYAFPRRMATGMDLNRCQILFASLEKHLGLNLENKDIFVSLAGGFKIQDPALDLAVCAAVISSIRDIAIPNAYIFAGEVGILGQLASISLINSRLSEAQRLGFTQAYIPSLSSNDRTEFKSLKINQIDEVGDLLECIIKSSDKSAAIS